jgi:hypothetical protein
MALSAARLCRSYYQRDARTVTNKTNQRTPPGARWIHVYAMELTF